jgi:hypothetical protein
MTAKGVKFPFVMQQKIKETHLEKILLTDLNNSFYIPFETIEDFKWKWTMSEVLEFDRIVTNNTMEFERMMLYLMDYFKRTAEELTVLFLDRGLLNKIPNGTDDINEISYKCPACGSQHMKMKTFRNHMIKKCKLPPSEVLMIVGGL